MMLAAVFLTSACSLGTGSGFVDSDSDESSAVMNTEPPASQAVVPPIDWLLDAEVPSLCDHPAGTLVYGSLPGLPATSGVVQLAGWHSGAWAEDRLADSWVGSDARNYSGAVFNCNQGGVSWPQHVVIYGDELQILDSIDLADILGDGRQSTLRLARAGDTLLLEVENTYQAGDPGCCGTKDALVAMSVLDQTVAVEILQEFNEFEPAIAAFKALIDEDEGSLSGLYTKDGLALARAQMGVAPIMGWNTVGGCAAASEVFEGFVENIKEPFDRACWVTSEDESWAATIAMRRTGYAEWVSVGVEASENF